MMQHANEVYCKIVKARAGLILEHPFFGSLALRMTLQEDCACETAWSDGKTLAYNPAYISMLTPGKLKGLMGHLAMHPACRHHIRRKGRNPKQWNMACDYAINWILLEAGLELPDGYLDDPEFRDKTADEIYSLMSAKADSDEKKDGHNRPSEKDKTDNGKEQSTDDAGREPDGRDTRSDEKETQSSPADDPSENAEDAIEGDGDFGYGDPGKSGEVRDAPSPQGESSLSDDTTEKENEWKIALAQAVIQAKSMGDLPAGLKRLVDNILNPKLDWRGLLGRFINASAHSDYTWTPPNRRYLHLGLYLPSMRSDDLPEVVIAVDTSGSISQTELDQFAAELSAILEYCAMTVHLLYCDMRMVSAETFQRQDLPIILSPKGGGGTDFRPAFHWVEQQGISPRCLIYLTDLECNRFPEEPLYPVLWARIGGAGMAPPFGEVIEIR